MGIHLLHEQSPLYPQFLFYEQRLGPLLPKKIPIKWSTKGITNFQKDTTELV